MDRRKTNIRGPRAFLPSSLVSTSLLTRFDDDPRRNVSCSGARGARSSSRESQTLHGRPRIDVARMFGETRGPTRAWNTRGGRTFVFERAGSAAEYASSILERLPDVLNCSRPRSCVRVRVRARRHFSFLGKAKPSLGMHCHSSTQHVHVETRIHEFQQCVNVWTRVGV